MLAMNLVRKILSDGGVRSAMFAFALTRAIVFAILIAANHLTLIEPARDFGTGLQETAISLRASDAAQRAAQALSYADSLWYINIARDGYERQPFDVRTEHTWAFFPLYPLLLNLAARVTGEFALTGSVLSNLFFFLALLMVYKTARAFEFDEAAADRTVFYLAAFPVSYFFSLPLTESLFLLLTASSFYAARRNHWWLAGAFGALASSTRLAGIFLFPALLIVFWQQREKRLRVESLALFLIPLGLFSFMLYLGHITGNAFAFFEVQAAWGHHAGFFLRPLFRYLRNAQEISAGWDFRLLNFAAGVLALACGLFLLKKRAWSLALYALLSVIAPLSAMALQSMARYVMVAFPIFFVLALAGQRPRVDQIIRALFISLLALMSALYALHFTLAMS